MSPSPMGWRPSYAAQFRAAKNRRVMKGLQTKLAKAMLKRLGLWPTKGARDE